MLPQRASYLVPNNTVSNMPMHSSQPAFDASLPFDKIDFSKPERFLREIITFLSNVTLGADLKIRGRSLSSTEA